MFNAYLKREKKMIAEELKQLGKEEAKKLKQHATKEELQNLSFSLLDPATSDNCIYGMMTGNCFNERATQLLNMCAKPYANDIFLDEETDTFTPAARQSMVFTSKGRKVFSPIEVYIMQRKAKQRNLIDYLKGETDTLEL